MSHGEPRGRNDENLRIVALSGGGLLILIALTLVVVKGFSSYLTVLEARRQAPPPAVVPPSQLPPEPRLQVSPAGDLVKLRAEEEAILEGYGWDKETGTFRIPIERAMEIIARQGLPARTRGGAGEQGGAR